jgi:hypothetical protein
MWRAMSSAVSVEKLVADRNRRVFGMIIFLLLVKF